MGAGASAEASVGSLNRLRKALVIRAYNLREKNQTLDDLFLPNSYRHAGQVCISVDAVKKTLSENAPWVDVLFAQMVGEEVKDLEFYSFIHFLETGNKPILVDPHALQQEKENSNRHLLYEKKNSMNKHNVMKGSGRVQPPTDLPPTTTKKGKMPPTPPRNNNHSQNSVHRNHSHRYNSFNHDDDNSSRGYSGIYSNDSSMRREKSFATFIPPFRPSSSSMYPAVVDALGMHTLAEGIHSGTLVRSGGLAVALDPKSTYRRPFSGPTRPLWRKREFVKQERTVEYTTVDADGVTQELTEKEITTTEVLHMECRETGEFAHRETTNYQQMEVFNDELVAEEKGNEEYVHMKSVDDEYEFLDSNMPKKEAPPSHEEPTGSPGAPTPVAEEKSMRNTSMHELNVSDDEDERIFGAGMQDCSPEDIGADRFKRGTSSGTDRFNDPADSPAGTGGKWSSMGGGGMWVPPPNTDYESEVLHVHDTDDDADRDRGDHIPAGRRRPDLFEPVSEQQGSADNDDDVDSLHGQTREEDLEEGDAGSRMENFLNTTGETMNSGMFRDYDEPDHHKDMNDCANNNNNFKNPLMSSSSSARWGSEDDID